MQAGVDPWEASGFLGMTVETLINTYGHHHPDYQSEAAEKITSKRSSVAGITSEPKKNAPHRNPGHNREQRRSDGTENRRNPRFSQKVTTFGTTGSQVQILPLRPVKYPALSSAPRSPETSRTTNHRVPPNPGFGPVLKHLDYA